MGADVKTRLARYRTAERPLFGALLLLVAVASLTVAGCSEGPSNPTGLLGASITAGDECVTPPEADLYAVRVVDLVNEERVQNGLGPLTTNATLTRLAGDYACEMINGNYFEHVNPVTGSTVGSRALAANYYFKKVGENLAGGFTSPEETVAQWMDSPGHRANILDPDFIEMGAAVRTGGFYRWYWVQEFGLPR
jgi:uncharacterized protein YkwD